MSESRWGDIYRHLQAKGFDVWSPGNKIGDCLAPYIVIKHDGSARRVGISTNEDFYSLLCYVPKQNYSEMESFLLSVKAAMKEMEPMIFPRGEETPSFYDDTFKAHMVSVTYKNYKKMM
jgi:hypothetical protein